MTIQATICAQLTPPGRGAVAVIGVYGPRTGDAIGQHFQPASRARYSLQRSRDLNYGVWSSTGEDLVVVRRGQQHVEIHCHGGNLACTAILNSLAESNVSQVSAQEFTESFEDRWAATTRMAVTQATTPRTAKLLLHSLQTLPKSIIQLNQLIATNQQKEALSQVGSMLRWAEFGIHLTQPRTIVLLGQPNVGKSSLVNAMVGFQRAIVHDIAGTTRDVVSQQTAIDGWPVELKDTAGLRDPTSQIESIGIEHAKSEINSADVKICVFDLSRKWTNQDQTLVQAIKPEIVVFNKSDLAPDSRDSFDHPSGLKTSVETGEGIKPLIDEIAKRLVPEFPDAQQAYPVTQSQRRELHQIAFQLMCPSQSPPSNDETSDRAPKQD